MDYNYYKTFNEFLEDLKAIKPLKLAEGKESKEEALKFCEEIMLVFGRGEEVLHNLTVSYSDEKLLELISSYFSKFVQVTRVCLSCMSLRYAD